MAALVQLMVPAEAAGVAFTANPLTGDLDEVVISAVAGLGERLVSGDATADEWVVRGSEASCRQSSERALNTEQARDVATVARKIERHFGTPQDVEWAMVRGQVHILQARPMTALPPRVEWKSPRPGSWTRQFRMGEWLSEPVTPLFESWLLTGIELGHASALYRNGGFLPPRPNTLS
jgi:rifampicin phosphotransferase